MIKELWPTPKKAVPFQGSIRPAEGFQLTGRIRPSDAVLDSLSAELAGWGSEIYADAALMLSYRLEGAGKAGSYHLIVQETGVTITAPDATGLFYGTQTFIQWLRIHRFNDYSRVGGLVVADEPDFPVRGVMLDVSRNRVPQMEGIFKLVRLFASLKLNQLQLYTEHTFAYKNHRAVWAGADPFTPEEIQELDAYCADRHIELVPNQNSFGHFHRWLVHEPYRRLAEVPAGVEHPFSHEKEPFTLCPDDPGSLSLLQELYDELLPNFSHSNLFNVGLDETFDLGEGRSKERCEKEGKTEVYLDFLKKVHGLVSERGRKMMFWGDIIISRPDLIPQLPKDAVPLEWGYEDDHPFDAHGKAFADSGLQYYVCPGTSSWQSIIGRAQNAVGNLAEAAVSGMKHGAAGYLITDWGDWGFLQPPPIAFTGYLMGAGFSWTADSAEQEPHIPTLLDLHVFRDRQGIMGNALWRLGNVYLRQGQRSVNGTALFFLIRFAEETLNHERLLGIDRNCIEQTLSDLHRIEDQLRESLSPWRDELHFALKLTRFLANLGSARLDAGREAPMSDIMLHQRKLLREELQPLIAEHRLLWARYCRNGGLDESAGRLQRLLDLLL